jgi:hypothetical protein
MGQTLHGLFSGLDPEIVFLSISSSMTVANSPRRMGMAKLPLFRTTTPLASANLLFSSLWPSWPAL